MDRNRIYEQINKLSLEEKLKFGNAVVESVIKTDFFKKAETIFLYKSLPNEIDTKKLINICFDMGKTVAVPVTADKIKMVIINEKTKFMKKKFGVEEPIEGTELFDADVAIVPMVAFDRRLNRVGHGKGYYDRFLADKQCRKIGIAFSLQESNEIVVKSTDIKMDIIITEKEIIPNITINNCNKI